jgi:hypothetical protein
MAVVPRVLLHHCHGCWLLVTIAAAAAVVAAAAAAAAAVAFPQPAVARCT